MKDTGSITPDTVYNSTTPLKADDLISKLSSYKKSLKEEVTKNIEEGLVKYEEELIKNKAKLDMYTKYKDTVDKLTQYQSNELARKAPTKQILSEPIKPAIDKELKDLAEKGKKTEETIAKLKEYDQSKDSIDTPVSSLQEYGFIKMYQASSNSNHLSTKTPLIKHFAIDAEKTKELNGFVDQGLHPIEECLILKAIHSLSGSSSAQGYIDLPSKSQSFPNNVVLVDIFKRNWDKVNTIFQIPLTASKSEVEIHTVVLWKTKDGEITLIDPSKYDFSKFLIGKSFVGYKIIAGQQERDILYSPGSKTPAYTDYNSAMVPRDCTDIAVKIGFELNQHQQTAASIDEVKNLAIAQVSNQYKGNLQKIEGLNTRPLQSSNFQERQEAKKVVDQYAKFSNVDFKNIKTVEEMSIVINLLGDLGGLPEAENFIEHS